MTTKGVIALAIAAASIMLSVAACTVDKPRYFHQVNGVAQFNGAVEGAFDLSPGHGSTGAANMDGSRERLALDLVTTELHLSASATGLSGPGTYPLIEVFAYEVEPDSPRQPFQCFPGCSPCEATLTEISDDAISGTLMCADLRSCGEPTPLPEPEGDPTCGGASSSVLDVTAEFKLSEGSNSQKDY